MNSKLSVAMFHGNSFCKVKLNVWVSFYPRKSLGIDETVFSLDRILSGPNMFIWHRSKQHWTKAYGIVVTGYIIVEINLHNMSLHIYDLRLDIGRYTTLPLLEGIFAILHKTKPSTLSQGSSNNAYDSVFYQLSLRWFSYTLF